MSRITVALVVALVLVASGWSLFGWEVSRGGSPPASPPNSIVVQQRDPCQNALAFARWYTLEGGSSIVARLSPTTKDEGDRQIFDIAFETCLTDSPQEP